MNSPAIYHRQNSMNETLTKDNSHALKKFLMEMRDKKFDEIRLATYRASAKLFFVQKSSNLNLVDIYNIIEAFRENGLNTLDASDEIDEPRLECIIASIFYALYKRLPAKRGIDVEKCIMILTQWIMHAYDSEGIGRVRVLSVKTALSTLCEGRLVDKFRYVFTQISEKNGILNVAKLDQYLRDLLMLPSAVGEEPNFGYSEDILDSFFKPEGPLNRSHTKLEDFLDALLNEKTSGVLFWLHMFNKISKSSTSEHLTQCKACGQEKIYGLRYKCQECYSYNMCQECYWRDKASGTHKAEHTSREYYTWNKNERGTSVKTKLLCSPSKSQHQRLPDYPKEPEPNKTLDMSNIVPALPSEPSSPMSTLSRTPRSPRMMTNGGSVSQFSTLSQSRKQSGGQGSDGPPSPISTFPRNNDEHALILMYAQKLANVRNEVNVFRNKSKSSVSSCEPTTQQRELEEKNRKLLNEIRILKQEHEEAVKNAQQMGCDPNLLTELRVLRQRKDELEMRMSALQETRRELMVQLEGLMKLLKNNQMSTPRQISRVNSNSLQDSTSEFRSPKTSGASSTLMRGVNGDVKEAFGKSSIKEANECQDLRGDLMNAVDEVTSAMADVVSELTKNRNKESSAKESRSSDEEETWKVGVQVQSSIRMTTSTAEVSVY